MTRDEAIEAIKCNWPDSRYTILREALDMAISALRQQGTVTSGEIALNAKTMTLDDAIAHLDDTLSDTGRKWSCESCRMEHVQLRTWLAELREIKQERNTPLTIDELRQMDGEPVWVSVSNNWRESGVSEGWCIVRFHSEDDRVRVYVYDTRHGARFFAQQDYGESWWAYRQKPKEGRYDLP